MIKIDFSNLLQDSIGNNGLTKEDFNNISRTALNDLLNPEKNPENGFLTLPDAASAGNTAVVKELGSYARHFDNFILLGIGGSALGPRSILEALRPFHNLRGRPRVFIYDNVDPMTLKNILLNRRSILLLPPTLLRAISGRS